MLSTGFGWSSSQWNPEIRAIRLLINNTYLYYSKTNDNISCYLHVSHILGPLATKLTTSFIKYWSNQDLFENFSVESPTPKRDVTMTNAEMKKVAPPQGPGSNWMPYLDQNYDVRIVMFFDSGQYSSSKDVLTYLRAKQRKGVAYNRMKLMVIGLQVITRTLPF